jgi:hypothetical protein
MPEVSVLAVEIADDAAVYTIERFADRAEGHPPGVWDTRAVDQAEIDEVDIVDMIAADLQRAVTYLDLRGRLLRPVAGEPHLVTIAEA